MNKYKFSTILLVIFFLSISNVSASSINYELKITNDKHFYETITYNIDDNAQNNYLISILNNNVYFDVNHTKLYKKTIGSSNGSHIVVLKNDYVGNNIKNSRILNECFDKFYYDEDNYRITYYASEPFKCIDRADKITISVVTDLNVIINTADEVIGNKYIWNNIDKDFSMDLSLGEYNPDSDVLPPIADDEVTSSDDIDDWPSGYIREFPYVYVIVPCSIIVLVVSFIFIRTRIKKANN